MAWHIVFHRSGFCLCLYYILANGILIGSLLMVVPAGCKDSNEDCFSIDLWKTACWYNGLHGQSTTSDAIQMCCQNRYSFIPGILSIMPATMMVTIHVWWLPTAEDWLNPAFIQEAFEARALRMAVNCAQNIGQASNQEEGSIYIIQHRIPFFSLNCTCSVLFGINCTNNDCVPCRFLWAVPRFAWGCGSSHSIDHCNQVSITSFSTLLMKHVPFLPSSL